MSFLSGGSEPLVQLSMELKVDAKVEKKNQALLAELAHHRIR